jgi:hypothetical protein
MRNGFPDGVSFASSGNKKWGGGVFVKSLSFYLSVFCYHFRGLWNLIPGLPASSIDWFCKKEMGLWLAVLCLEPVLS